ncbi:globin domain-containing protein [Lignipirellula cremea]|uniref:Flavohemoprotein n=1 Tax=Lignipirellula cremea TaxID=2528010 RepID=A0A518DLB8_9BACT|nr:globin domain-containing protein [Lignipirellula cremea]QDU92629.1 Flavohemoprotein [Lignipirellula cremea]
MKSIYGAVIASYHRARHTDQFFDTFYGIFLRKSPEIQLMFVHTDFPHQKLMLKESLLELLLFAECPAECEVIQRIGRRHTELKVKPEMYAMWVDALCEALALHDPEFSADLEQAWRNAMQPGIDLMLTVAKPPSGPGNRSRK